MSMLAFTRIMYLVAWLVVTTLYLIDSKAARKNYIERQNKAIDLIRKIDLNEQFRMLNELHEEQSKQSNVSIGDASMMNLINEYIEKTAQQLRYLDNKKEPSENTKD